MAVLSTSVATIPINTALSQGLLVEGHQVVGFQMPAAWTAAALSFKGSVDGVTYGEVVDSSAGAAACSAAVDVYIALTAAQKENLRGCRYLVIRSGTSGTPVNQAAAREIQVILEPRVW